MIPKPGGLTARLGLVVIAMIVAQGLITTIAPLLPWLVLGLVVVLGIVAIVATIIRRTNRW
jgi:hypothetical protein